jgi:hypothetical protein
MICSSVNRERRIVRLLIDGLYSNLEEVQGLRSISVSSLLLDSYDEPEILPSSSRQICLTGADAGQPIEKFLTLLPPSKTAEIIRDYFFERSEF